MSMSYENIMFQLEGGVGIIKFNRPKVMNAINIDVLAELKDVLNNRVANDQNVKVLVLTGEGRAFIAGADIAGMREFTPLQGKKFTQNGQEIFSLLESLPIPVIACVNGVALGGGCEIAMACDFVYASEKAKFGQPEINLGVTPGFGGTQRLSRLVGKQRALELCLTGKIISASEALDMGLINKVLPNEELWGETMKVANIMASKSRIALRGIKNSIQDGFDCDAKIGCIIESDAFALCMSGNDAREGMAAFLEKREPQFKDQF